MTTNPSKFSSQDVGSGKNASPSNLTSSTPSAGDATSSVKGENGQESVAGKSVYYPPTIYYNYSYPGHNGNSSQVDEYNYSGAGGSSYTGYPSDDGSLLYYLPGSFMGLEGQQPYYSSQGYSQHPVSFAPEVMQGYSWNPAYFGDTNNGANKSKATFGSNGSSNSSFVDSSKPSGSVASRSPVLPFAPNTRKSASSLNVSNADNQDFRSWGQVGSSYQTANVAKGSYPFNKYSSFYNQSQGLSMHNTPNNYRPYTRIWSGNNRSTFRERNGDLDASTELTCGPRVHNTSSDPAKEEHMRLVIQKNQCNGEEFQTEYENAKFFIIKSYSEDDVHKSVKYNVWSSTLNGNKKLNAAYNDAEVNASCKSPKSPVFLFFSVNTSGQFVGVAEMVGPVDFNKDMEFWQLDKWNGFFPLRWHIVKDVPNTQLRHIILENNDNRPVTYSRDTQEIGLKEGIEMLKIFKSFSGKASILDDFNFYDIREKALMAKRNNKKHVLSAEGAFDAAAESKGSVDATSSLVNLTRNLSLNSRPQESATAVPNSGMNSNPTVPPA